MALTRLQITTRARRSLGLMNAQGYKLLTKGHMNHICNQAQQEIRIELMDRIEQYTGTFTANQRDHSLPTDFLREWRIFVAPSGTFQGYPMQPKPYSDLVPISVRLDPTPDAIRADGTTYYYYSISSDRIIYIDPIFSTATTFHLFYVKLPTDMTTGSDTPDIEENLHELVLLKTCVLAARDAGLADKYMERMRMYQDALHFWRPFVNAKESRMTVPARSY